MTDELEEREGIYGLPEPVIPPTERELFIPTPTPTPMPEPVLVPEPTPEPEPEDELADLFEVPQETDNDMRTSHLVSIEDIGDDDLSDLVEVSHSDIMGDGIEEPFPGTPATIETPELIRRFPVRRYKRTSRRPPPPTSLSGFKG